MSIAAALAVALAVTGLIVAVVPATGRLMWRGLSDRIVIARPEGRHGVQEPGPLPGEPRRAGAGRCPRGKS